MKARRIIACLVIVCLMASNALAAGYSSSISSIMSTFSYQNIMASSAPQQQVNGAYRMVELLEVMAKESGCSSSSVSSVMSTFSYQNIMASSAPQQAVNGLYRSVELLELITKYMDTHTVL